MQQVPRKDFMEEDGICQQDLSMLLPSHSHSLIIHCKLLNTKIWVLKCPGQDDSEQLCWKSDVNY